MNPSAAGYTLLEMVVVIAVIGIASSMLLRGYPVLRAQQQLKIAEQQIQSTLREAQALALNEAREDNCKNRFPNDEAQQRFCSDIGVKLEGDTITLFADLDFNDQYNQAIDYLIREASLTSNGGAGVVTATTVVFRARPPKVWLSVNENNKDGDQAGESTHTIEVQSGRSAAILNVGSFGQVTRAN